MKKSVFIASAIITFFFMLAILLVVFLLVKLDKSRAWDFIKKKRKRPKIELVNMSFYTILQGLHLIIFVGFGFFMTYMKKYARSGLAFTLLLSSFVIIWYIILDGLFNMNSDNIFISTTSLIRADLAAIAFLVSYGAVAGKFNILQLFLMAFLETVIYAAHKYLMEEVIMAVDAGGSTWLHMFGACFGLGVSLVHGLRGGPRKYKTDLELSSYETDTYSMIGTLFLWTFWPILNASSSLYSAQSRALINTYVIQIFNCVILCGSLIYNSEQFLDYKFSLIEVQRSSLSAGISVASIAALKLSAIELLLISYMTNFIVYITYKYIQPFLAEYLRMHDTNAILSFFAFPGLIGGLAGIVETAWATEDNYGQELYVLYPAMSPNVEDRSRLYQVLYQFCSIISSMGIGFAGGLLTGCFIVLPFQNLPESELYQDEHHWEVDGNE